MIYALFGVDRKGKAAFDGDMPAISSIRRPAQVDAAPRNELFVGLIAIPATLVFGGLAALFAQFAGRSCGTKSLLGLPCPSCGTTRALTALLQGDPVQAFALQPLMMTIGGLAILYMLYAAAVVLFKMPPFLKWPRSRPLRGLLFATLIVLVTANWIFLLIDGR